MATESALDEWKKNSLRSDAFVQFFKDTSVKPDEINPILESKKSAKVKQQDKMFKLYARPNITIEDMRKWLLWITIF